MPLALHVDVGDPCIGVAEQRATPVYLVDAGVPLNRRCDPARAVRVGWIADSNLLSARMDTEVLRCRARGLVLALRSLLGEAVEEVSAGGFGARNGMLLRYNVALDHVIVACL